MFKRFLPFSLLAAFIAAPIALADLPYHPVLDGPYVPDGCTAKLVYLKGGPIMFFFKPDGTIVHQEVSDMLSTPVAISAPPDTYIHNLWYGGSGDHRFVAKVRTQTGALIQTLAYSKIVNGNRFRGTNYFFENNPSARWITWSNGTTLLKNNWLVMTYCPNNLELEPMNDLPPSL
jgi:hypothetical protein